MATGHHLTRTIYAQHGFGLCRYSGSRIPTTFLFGDADLRQQLGWTRGLLEDGAAYQPSTGPAAVIALVGAAPAQARRAA